MKRLKKCPTIGRPIQESRMYYRRLRLALTAAVIFLSAATARADWMQPFEFISTGPDLTSFDITNAAIVSPSSALTISLSDFSDPFFTWSYLYPQLGDFSDISAAGGPDHSLAFSIDFATAPTVPIRFQFNAFSGGNPFVSLGGANVSWDGVGHWTFTQIESDVPLANFTATPEPPSWLLSLTGIGCASFLYSRRRFPRRPTPLSKYSSAC
jgi:hypothetical protein